MLLFAPLLCLALFNGLEVDGSWGDWTSWTTCSATCGHGRMTRSRNCHSEKCTGVNKEALHCNERECPECFELKMSATGSFPDEGFSASSVLDSKHLAHYGRLSSKQLGWAPSDKDRDSGESYLQVDLGKAYTLCKIRTHGNGDKSGEWTRSYKLQLSLDGKGKHWAYYQEENGVDRVFYGNWNAHSIATNVFNKQAIARFVRFRPVSYHVRPTTRLALYATNWNFKVCHDIGVSDSSVIPDSSFTASSFYPFWENQPKYGRLTTSKQGWSPSPKGKDNSYLQVDLGRVYALCSIKTRGSSIFNEYTKTFKLQLSLGGKNNTWVYYQEEDGIDRVFERNERAYHVATQYFAKEVYARFVRFRPITYQHYPTTRLAIYVTKADGSWNDWSEWTSCSTTCGEGERKRSRTCTPPMFGGKKCSGESEEFGNCKEKDCPD